MEQSQQVLLGTAEQRSMLGPEGLIASTVRESGDTLREVRRHLHRHPELSHQEHATTDFIDEHLRGLGLSPQRMAHTGLICDIPGSDPSLEKMALRADMDALGIPELTTVAYRSTVEGVSHACGHDVHMSAVLGAARARDGPPPARHTARARHPAETRRVRPRR